ncbi:hypothetical protein NMY22_g1799 [Coprinellus aureogranulatus]|nr:hypothetical protein NMY22_g1799 [Coprinellus aureogranulatus]
MDAVNAVAALQVVISDLQGQIEDLKQDKKDLRADKDGLKSDNTRLNGELQAAMSEVLRLGQELHEAKSNAEDVYQNLQKAQARTLELENEVQQSKGKTAPERSFASCATQTNIIREAVSGDAISVLDEVAPVPDAICGTQEGVSTQDPSREPCVVPTQEAHLERANLHSMTVNVRDEAETDRTGKRKADGIEPGAAVSEPPRKRGRPKKLGTIRLPALANRIVPTTRTMSNMPVPSRPVINHKLDEAFVLPKDEVAWHLKDTLPGDASMINYAAASRDCLYIAYGGSHCQSLQLVKAECNPSGSSARVFAFPNAELSPHMPLVPGESGLVLGNHYDRALSHVCTSVFGVSGPTRLYLGEYMWEKSRDMSAEAFRGQRETVSRPFDVHSAMVLLADRDFLTKVKECWASEIMGERRMLGEAQASQRARIALRKAGLLPVGNRALEVELVRQELERVKNGEGHPVGRKDIIAAFEHEAVPVIRLRYSSYDATLAGDIERKYAIHRSTKGTPQKNLVTSKKVAGSGDKKKGLATAAGSVPLGAMFDPEPQPDVGTVGFSGSTSSQRGQSAPGGGIWSQGQQRYEDSFSNSSDHETEDLAYPFPDRHCSSKHLVLYITFHDPSHSPRILFCIEADEDAKPKCGKFVNFSYGVISGFAEPHSRVQPDDNPFQGVDDELGNSSDLQSLSGGPAFLRTRDLLIQPNLARSGCRSRTQGRGRRSSGWDIVDGCGARRMLGYLASSGCILQDIALR